MLLFPRDLMGSSTGATVCAVSRQEASPADTPTASSSIIVRLSIDSVEQAIRLL